LPGPRSRRNTYAANSWEPYQVLPRLREEPLLALAYAGGFAAGNAAGILLERRLALGEVAVSLISPRSGDQVAEHLRRRGQRLTTFQGQGRDGPVTMIYITSSRRGLRPLLEEARVVDPHLFYLFYAVEPLREGGASPTRPLHLATRWRAALGKKWIHRPGGDPSRGHGPEHVP
jgi:hypothetical protein